ncbi:MAG: PAS domain S-box protein [Candidatus Scalindua sp.]|nr:PAS domain S-box protein [Candidatus Scalindua sp.]
MDRKKIHILMVEDEDSHVELISKSFESVPGSVTLTFARNLHEAYSSIAKSTPDLIIANFLLSDGKGIELIPAKGEESPYPVIIMISYVDTKVAVEVMKTGAFDYIVKPAITMDDMFCTCERVMRELSHITKCKAAEAELNMVFKGTSTDIGKNFFYELTKYLQVATKAHVVFCAELVDHVNLNARTLTICIGEVLTDNFEWNLIGTPCEHVIKNKAIFFAENVQAEFPNDEWLVTIGAESYLAIPFINASGKVIGHMGILGDKSKLIRQNIEGILKLFAARAGSELERKQTYAKQQFTQFAVDNNSVATFLITSDASISYANKAACQSLGYHYEELVCLRVTDFDQNFPEGFWPVHWQEMKGAGTLTFESHHKTKAGLVFPVDIQATFLVYEGKEYICAYVRNITKRKESEQQLRKLYHAIEQSSSAVIITDNKGNTEYVNPKFATLTGYTFEEVISKNISVLQSNTTPPEVYKSLRETIASGKEWRGESCNKKKNGKLYWESTSISPVKDDKDIITNFIVVKDDITKRKETENALKKSEEKYRTLVDTTNTIPWEFDASTGRFTFIGIHAVELFGYPVDEWLKENFWQDHIHPDDREDTINLCMEYTQKSEDHLLEYRMMTADNNIIWVYDAVQVINDDNGTKRLQGIIVNITERKKMEEALVQSERLQSIGTIAAGISHEFNNLLAIISGNVQLLEQAYNDHDDLIDALRTIRRATDDGAKISSKMLEFARTKQDIKEFVSSNIQDFIRQSIDFTKPRWKNEAQARGINYQVDKEVEKGIPSIMCNPTEIREVFINIINNALDAMSEGGSISFSTWSCDHTVFVSISDTGEGMSEDVIKNIFDPFFTTKLAMGTGLGMSIAYVIIARHGGQIEVNSVLGQGSTFTLQFPTTYKTENLIATPGPEQEANEKNLYILVVDDEEEICNILNKFLSKSGHKVKTVNNGADAIEIVIKEEFDLVLCDLAMPEVFGYEVIKVINKLEKRPKTGLITGWNEGFKPSEAKEFEVDFIARKPFNFPELSKHIMELFV